MSMLVPLILDRLRDFVTDEMQTYVPENDPSWAVLVKIGRFQDDPTKKNVAVAISGGDFEDPAYIDGRIDNPALDDLQIINLPVGEIGGGQYWWRRGTIDLRVYFIRQRFEEEVAHEHAYNVYGRLVKAIEACSFVNMTDDFGELANGFPYVEKTSFYEGGGPTNQYLWRGKLWWRILTWRP